MAYSPSENAANSEIIRYDLGWDAINAMLRAGRSLSGHERNCCFLNTAGSRFADISGVAGLDFDDDGRVLALADWDYDGDVDFWVANRSGPQIRYLQNELSAAQNFLKLRFEGVQSNRDAIGTRVVVRSDAGLRLQTQTLRAGEGYLAQNSKWLHFGLGATKQVREVTVEWPSGRQQRFANLDANRWYRIREGENPSVWEPPQLASREPSSSLEASPVSDKARIVLLNPIPLSALEFETETGESASLTAASGKPKLVNLWATWCAPCLKELAEWNQISDALSAKGIQVIALNADEASSERTQNVMDAWDKLGVSFQLGFADENLIAQFDTLQRALLSRQRPLPLPSSFLIDGDGRLRIVYKGPVDPDTLLDDAELTEASREQILSAAVPFDGRWMVPPGGSTPLHLTVKYIDNDLSDTARNYIESLIAGRERHPEYVTASITNLYGAILLDNQEFDAAREAFQLSLELDPTDRQAHIELGTLLVRGSRGAEAEPHFAHVLKVTPNDPELLYFLAVSLLQQGRLEEAKSAFQRSIAIRPSANAYWQLGTVAIGLRDARLAIRSYERGLEQAPSLANSANNLAWLLCTIEDDQLRNGERGLELATNIAQQKPKDPTVLDTLAAAYAETGQYERAQSVAQQAIDAATAAGRPQLASKITQRMENTATIAPTTHPSDLADSALQPVERAEVHFPFAEASPASIRYLHQLDSPNLVE